MRQARVYNVRPELVEFLLVVVLLKLAALFEELIVVDLRREGSAGELHHRTSDDMRILNDEQCGTVAGQFGPSRPGQECACDSRRDDELDDLGTRNKTCDAQIGERFHQLRRSQVEHMFGVDVTDLVSDHGERLFVVKPLDKRRMKYDDRLFDAAGERVYERVLLDVHIRHVHAERRTSDLELGMKVGALLWR